jgi:Fe-S-cluster formation regulator IscX/YfhJ
MSDTVVFGDLDPEDAYDAGDPSDLRIAVIRNVIVDLRARKDDDARFENRRHDMRRVIYNFIDEHPELQTELEDLRDDLEAL